MRRGEPRHLLSMGDLDRADIEQILHLTESFAEVGERSIPKVPALRGKTIAWLFYEDSTRTRLSFETAAKRLSADTMNFSVSSSSVNKGESLRDTVETIAAMGIDGVVVRHRAAGAPHQVAQWTDAAVINAGDGWHQHPTQGLLDLYTATQHLGALDGKHVAIVGDITHSRVARSNAIGFATMGAKVTLVGPPTLLPPSLDGWPVEVCHDIDAVIDDLDICYLLRMQLERQKQAVVPTLREYHQEYGLTSARADRLGTDALIMHPGPMNRGVEIAGEVADRVELVGGAAGARGAVVDDLELVGQAVDAGEVDRALDRPRRTTLERDALDRRVVLASILLAGVRARVLRGSGVGAAIGAELPRVGAGVVVHQRRAAGRERERGGQKCRVGERTGCHLRPRRDGVTGAWSHL